MAARHRFDWVARWPLLVLAALITWAVLSTPGMLRSGPTAFETASSPLPAPQAAGAAPTPAFIAVDTLPSGWTMTRFGPLGPADRELLVKVRQAGLWEAPVGEEAQKQAGSQRVKDVGKQLAADHHALDEQVRSVAAQLQVDLPAQPSAQQQSWMAELAGKQGADFDRTFANRLRAAHGQVFALVSAVRAGTRNDLVRTFAQTGINVVMKHMSLLESTGSVDYGALPAPAIPSTTAAPVALAPAAAASRVPVSGAPMSGGRNVFVWIVLGLAVFAGIPAMIRVVRLR